MSDLFRMDCWFEGRVQGVGFRYQTMNVAKTFEVSGTVRNLADGRVHLYAEGQESEVRAFQQAVVQQLRNYIRTAKIETSCGPRMYDGFDIVY